MLTKNEHIDLVNDELACLESQVITAYLLQDCPHTVTISYLKVVKEMYQGEQK